MTERRSLRLDDQGRIDQDLLCRACDYNLRGLHESADCPECSTPIARSTRPDLLRFSDPSWLTRLSKGMLLIIIGRLAGIIGGALLGGLVVVLPMTGVTPGTIFTASTVITAIFLLTAVAGVWLGTTPEPGRPEPDGHVTVRRTARWCVMVQVVSGPMQMAAGAPGGFVVTAPVPTMLIVVLMLGVVAFIGEAAGLVYLRRLAVRIPAPKLARSTKIVMWGYLSCQIIAVAVTAVLLAVIPGMAAAGGAPTPGISLAMGVSGCGVGVGALVFGIWLLVLLFRYKSAFTKAAEQAKASWGA